MPKKITQSDFLKRCYEVHQDKYDYSNAVYVSAKSPVKIVCGEHGPFYPSPLNFIHGKTGCPLCAGRGVDWVERFISVHGDTYDYSKFEYLDYKQPAVIICKQHGEFLQTPDNHFRGKQGCPMCKGRKIQTSKQMSFIEFVEKANKKHKNRFTYSYDQWTNVLTGKVLVHCTHGVTTQTPVNHLSGKVSCAKCGNKKSSPEMEVADYLKIFIPVVHRDRQILKPKELDIYVPDANLAVEYNGMFWHSHGSVEEELKNKNNHQHKYEQCAAKGIRLITIYETEWLERQQAIKRLLRNAVGKAKGKLMARKCELKKTTHQEAVAFYEKYHPQGGAGNGDYYGLYWKGKLVACMRFTYGINDRGVASSNRVWTLSRYATRVNVVGGASKLFKAFIDEHNPSEVKSFSDNRYFSGGMYQQLGFSLDAEIQPDYQIWSMKGGLKTKAQYQRRCIQARLTEHGIDETFDPENDVRSERDMTYLMGARRIYDCGKKRWVWKSK